MNIKNLINTLMSNLRKYLVLGENLENKNDTRLLKSMDDYKINFDLDSKIAWNRHRMRELFEMYKKIENYYPLFFAFLGFIGIYYFDFIITLINNFNYWFLLTSSLTTIGLVWSLYYMVRIIFTNEWKHDMSPKSVYIKSFDDWTVYLKKQKIFTESELDKNVREAYLDALEKGYEINFNFYTTKKNYVSNILKVILITLIIYSINIIHYKQIDIMLDEKPKSELPSVKEEVNYNKPLVTDSISKQYKIVKYYVNSLHQQPSRVCLSVSQESSVYS